MLADAVGLGFNSCEFYSDFECKQGIDGKLWRKCEMGNAKAGRGGFLVLIHAILAIFLRTCRA